MQWPAVSNREQKPTLSIGLEALIFGYKFNRRLFMNFFAKNCLFISNFPMGHVMPTNTFHCGICGQEAHLYIFLTMLGHNEGCVISWKIEMNKINYQQNTRNKISFNLFPKISVQFPNLWFGLFAVSNREQVKKEN